MSTTRLSRSSAVVLLLLAAACAGRELPSPAGIWIHQEPWTSAPPEMKDERLSGYAPGIVLRFCPNGCFRMATGIFYGPSPKKVNLGASDGLTLYEGTWTQSGESVMVRYRLVGVEIGFKGLDEAKRKTIVEHPQFDGRTLTFDYRDLIDGKRHPTRFQRGERIVSGNFVECGQ